MTGVCLEIWEDLYWKLKHIQKYHGRGRKSPNVGAFKTQSSMSIVAPQIPSRKRPSAACHCRTTTERSRKPHSFWYSDLLVHFALILWQIDHIFLPFNRSPIFFLPKNLKSLSWVGWPVGTHQLSCSRTDSESTRRCKRKWPKWKKRCKSFDLLKISSGKGRDGNGEVDQHLKIGVVSLGDHYKHVHEVPFGYDCNRCNQFDRLSPRISSTFCRLGVWVRFMHARLFNDWPYLFFSIKLWWTCCLQTNRQKSLTKYNMHIIEKDSAGRLVELNLGPVRSQYKSTFNLHELCPGRPKS